MSENFELSDYLARIATALETANELAAQRNAISREALDLQNVLLVSEQEYADYAAHKAKEAGGTKNFANLVDHIEQELGKRVRAQSLPPSARGVL